MRSRPSEKSIIVLRAVADGKSLAEAGKLIGRSATTVRQMLFRLCRAIQMPSDISEIQSNKVAYLQIIGDMQLKPDIKLNHKIAYNLLKALKISDQEELTPKYVSNVSAFQLLDEGLTLTAVADVQIWLVQHGLSLKPKPPQNQTEMVAVKRSIALLDAFHFDAKIIRQQIAQLESNDD
jgi:hypothetical protein